MFTPKPAESHRYTPDKFPRPVYSVFFGLSPVMLVCIMCRDIFINHSPAPTIQRLPQTLGPAYNRPLPALLHELHSRLYLGTWRELPFCKVAAPKVSGGGDTLDQIRWSYSLYFFDNIKMLVHTYDCLKPVLYHCGSMDDISL